jgi:glycerol-3-phosphate dehydrogenase
MAEVACCYEIVDDVLARRVRLLFLDARAAVASCEKVAKLLQRN